MGGKSSPPPAPNYAEIIPLQERSNINQFNTMLNASRVNSITPFGRQTWYRPGEYPSGGQVTVPKPPASSQVAPASADPGPEPPRAQAKQKASYEDEANKGPWTLVQELSPEQQRLYEQDLRIRQGQGDIAEGMLGNVSRIYGTPVNFADRLPEFERVNAPEYTGRGSSDLAWQGPGYRTSGDTREAAEQALYSRQTRYLDPQMQRQEQALHERLLAQGFNVGDEAYRRAMDDFAAQRERAYADARDAAIAGGGREATEELQRGLAAEQARFGAGLSTEDLNARLAQALFAARMSGAQLGQSERDRALQHALQSINLSQQDRARALNEMNAFRTGQQVQTPGLPAQFSTPQLQGIDHLGLANQTYQNQLGAYNAQQAAAGDFLSGLFGLAGTLGGSYMMSPWIGLGGRGFR